MDVEPIDEELENFRFVFLQSEKELLNEMVKNPYYIHLFKRFRKMPPEKLFEYSKKMMESIELGKVRPKYLEDYEKVISIMLLCTSDGMRKTLNEIVQKHKEALKAQKQKERNEDSNIEQ